MLSFMTENNFDIGPGNSLCCDFKNGYSFVLFYSTKCQHCGVAQEIFKYLSDTVVGCEFGMVNLDENKRLISLCNETTLKIEFVPLLVFFANGTAYMMYSGPLQESNIRQFIEQVAYQYAEEHNNSMEISDRKTLINDIDGCNINDESCKLDYKKKLSGVYCTLKEAYSNR